MSGTRVKLFALTFLAAGTVFLTACDPGITVRVENQTDADVYVFMSGSYNTARAERRPNTTDLREAVLVQPGEASNIVTLCYSNTTNWVVLLAKGEEVYARSTSCGRWLHSNARVSIDGAAGSYRVTDSLGTDPSQIPEDEVGKPTPVGLAIVVVTAVASTMGFAVAMFIALRFFYRHYTSKTITGGVAG